MRKGGRPTVRRSVLPLLVLAALAAASLASAAPERSTGTNLTIVGYSIPTAVFPKLTAAYQSTRAGNGVDFSSSFAASEVQSKAVAAGLPADVVNFSIETDMNRLVGAKLVDKSWANNRYHGIVSKSVVVFVLRNGNPKHIRTWDDLVRFVEWGRSGGLFPDESHFWWEMRPHPVHGTIEIRVADTQSALDDATSIVAVIQALVAMLSERFDAGEPLPFHETSCGVYFSMPSKKR